MALKKLQVSSKKIEDASDDGLLSNVLYKVCIFCDKMVRMSQDNYQSCINMSRNRFYCPFCLRNNHHLKTSRNVLIFSYRAIIGYYYFKHYREKTYLYLNQIETFIDLHQKIGIRNPALSYDPESYLWYADFNKIGTDSWKAPYEEVMQSAEWVLTCFELNKVLLKNSDASSKHDKMWNRFSKAFELFYQQRKRPKERRTLIPTLYGLDGVLGDKDFFEATRNFVPNMLNLK